MLFLLFTFGMVYWAYVFYGLETIFPKLILFVVGLTLPLGFFTFVIFGVLWALYQWFGDTLHLKQ